MRAVIVTDPGGRGRAPTLALGEVAEPRLRPGEALVEIEAAGVNRADLLQARGGYSPPPGESDIMGLECSGRIVAIHDVSPRPRTPSPGHTVGTADAPDIAEAPDAASTAGFAVGDAVCALLAGGGYAERVAVPLTQLLPIPAGLSPVEAAGLPEAACTVWSNLVHTARLQAGETLLVHGGASGIGTIAIQVAAELGARVVVTASSREKLDTATDLGASVGIDYTADDFVARVADATDGRGVEVILDVVGGDYLARNIAALADGGRLVVIGLLGGARAPLDLGVLMRKRAAVIGTMLRSRPASGPGSKAAVVADVRRHLWPLVSAGAVRPVIGRTLPLAEAAEAHRALAAGEVTGKVVLEI